MGFVGTKPCQSIDCRNKAMIGHKYCAKCHGRIWNQMRSSNYLTPIPRAYKFSRGTASDECGDGGEPNPQEW